MDAPVLFKDDDFALTDLKRALMAAIDAYLWLKWLHVLSSTILFGTGIGTAFQMWFAHRRGEPAAIAVVARNVVLADWLFTLPADIVQPLTGFSLILQAGTRVPSPPGLSQPTFSTCWPLPAGCRWSSSRSAYASWRRDAVRLGTPLPAEYHSAMRLWLALGWPAFLALVVIFLLMIGKPDLW